MLVQQSLVWPAPLNHTIATSFCAEQFPKAALTYMGSFSSKHRPWWKDCKYLETSSLPSQSSWATSSEFQPLSGFWVSFTFQSLGSPYWTFLCNSCCSLEAHHGFCYPTEHNPESWQLNADSCFDLKEGLSYLITTFFLVNCSKLVYKAMGFIMAHSWVHVMIYFFKSLLSFISWAGDGSFIFPKLTPILLKAVFMTAHPACPPLPQWTVKTLHHYLWQFR